MAGMTYNRQLLLAKVETTPGEDAVPTATVDAILVRDFSYVVEVARRERPVYYPDISKRATRAGRKTVTVTFTAEIKGGGAQANKPRIGRLLMGCGFAETVLAANAGWDYDPVSSNFSALTFYWYVDGMLYKALGSRGSFNVVAAAGEDALVNFTFQGSYVDPADATFPASPVYETTEPPMVENTALAISGYVDCAQQFTIDVANTVNPRLCTNAAEGVSGYLLTERTVTGAANPEAQKVTTMAANNVFTKLKDGSTGSFTATIGSVDNNICIITGLIQYTGVTPNNRDGALIYDLAYSYVATAGNDEIKFKFPAAA